MALQTLTSQSILNTEYSVTAALDQLASLTNGSIYLGIGHNQEWTLSDSLIEVPQDSTDYLNQVHRNLCAIKQLSVSSGSLVIPRVDWIANTYVYDAYSNSASMFSTTETNLANGTASVSNSTTLTGVGTTFTLDFQNNDLITLPGDQVFLLPQTREVINVVSNTQLVVNASFLGNFVSNTISNQSNSYPFYSLNFYVRNSFDQVFVCLDNNGGVLSEDMPQISIGGQLPTNPYVVTNDGYLWKYLYTMSAGLKKLFFTTNWMPVAIDNTVLGAATDGRIDIIDIVDGGQGYNQNVASFNAPILQILGDGTGANITAQVDANGTIYGTNIISGGEGYTTVSITANTGANGAGAILSPVIGPRGGWGANNYYQLGAKTLMITTTLADTEAGTIPTVDLFGEFFTYRQICLIKNPTFTANDRMANSVNYDMTTVIEVSTNQGFQMNDFAYQSPNTGLLQDATFSGTVVWFDESSNELHLNNVEGAFQPQSPIYGVVGNTTVQNNAPYVTATAFSLTQSPINTFSGYDLYVENNPAISRFPLQKEEIRLILTF